MTGSNTTLAIDPGYDRIGWAVGQTNGDKPKIAAFGCIQTIKTDSLTKRYKHLEDELLGIIKDYNPNTLAIETLFFSKNTTTALKVAEARGIIIGCCVRHGMDVTEYNPGTIKLAVTGNGKADKRAMEKMVRLQMALPTEKIIDDAIDALAILLTHSITKR
jgi:crossover junction endodeoxyribonuclease RuvC